MTDERSPDTVTEAVALLRRDGYAADFELIDGMLQAESDSADPEIAHHLTAMHHRIRPPGEG